RTDVEPFGRFVARGFPRLVCSCWLAWPNLGWLSWLVILAARPLQGRPVGFIGSVMERDGSEGKPFAGGKGDAARAARLRAALRENLRRRKSQARGRSEAGSLQVPPETAVDAQYPSEELSPEIARDTDAGPAGGRSNDSSGRPSGN